jgi:hypothetical protein
MDEDGTPFGRYRLVELLGRGGMGEVWRAYDTATDRVVALKVLPANFADDQVFQERFRREAHAAAGLDEPHVVPIYDFGEIEGRLYVTMRLIRGRDLQTVLAEGPLSAARAVGIIEQVAQAVQAAHKVGLVHRDIKPSNILLGDNDFAYLIDFGIARAAGETGLTSTGATIGTWSYMAPERFQSGTADARADIYALACVLYESLTGRPPFSGESLEQIAVAHMLTPPPRPSLQAGVPPAMDQVIATGMAKNPDLRYATTVELARAAHDATMVPLSGPGPSVPVHQSSQPDLVAAASIHGQDTQLAATGAAPVLPPPPTTPTQKRPGWRRPGVVVPAVVAIVVLIGGGVFAAVKVSHRRDHQPTTAAPPAAAPGGRPPDVSTFAAPAPPPNRPPQGNCPPACTQIPDSAWIAPRAIPLYNDYSWPPLGPLSEPVSSPRFEAEELCAAPPVADDERRGALASRIILPNPPGQWQLQVQILHWRGDPWIAGQRASAVMDSATSLLRNNCLFTVPGVSVSRIGEQNVPGHPGQSLTAVITATGTQPAIAHEYLVSDLRNSTVVELAMSSTSPPAVDWPTINDDQLLADLVAPLCTAFVNSCTT